MSDIPALLDELRAAIGECPRPTPMTLYQCQFCIEREPDSACGFDGESLDRDRYECHHPLDRREGERIVAAFNALPAMLAEIERLRTVEAAMRTFLDARGHDRCWRNEIELRAALGEDVAPDLKIPPRAEFLGRCERYYEDVRTLESNP